MLPTTKAKNPSLSVKMNGFFSPHELAIIHKAYIRPFLEFDLHYFKSGQKKAFRLIGDINITNRFDSLDYRRKVSAVITSTFTTDVRRRFRMSYLHSTNRFVSLIRWSKHIPLWSLLWFSQAVRFKGTFFSTSIRL